MDDDRAAEVLEELLGLAAKPATGNAYSIRHCRVAIKVRDPYIACGLCILGSSLYDPGLGMKITGPGAESCRLGRGGAG